MELVFLLVKIMSASLLVALIGMLIRLLDSLVLKPERLRSKLLRQGIRGPPPSFLIGNTIEMLEKRSESNLAQGAKQVITHNCFAAVFPYLDKWRKQYGPTFMFSMGNILVLHMSHPDAVKEMTAYTSFDLGKPSSQQKALDPLFGLGLVQANGAAWAHHRKVQAPELYTEKVKGMIKLMLESAVTLINAWNSKVDSEGGVADIKIDEYLRNFSGEVISRACFGSTYKEIFSKLRALQEIASKNLVLQGIPGLRSLPTKSNRKMWKLDKEVRKLILQEVKQNKDSTSENILQMIVEGAKRGNLSQDATDNFILDSCKNVCFPAYENGAVTVSWILMLLALYPEWQDRVRAEILEICGGQLPSSDMLPKMKTLTMVINETMRLYTLGSILNREALEDTRFGGVDVPKGVNVWVALIAIFHDPSIWGPDVHEFKPERFANGIKNACNLPHVYIPFGTGPRSCVGQHFMMAELKIVVSLILSNFAFSLSPKYIHSPVMNLIIEPEFGVDLLVRRV